MKHSFTSIFMAAAMLLGANSAAQAQDFTPSTKKALTFKTTREVGDKVGLYILSTGGNAWLDLNGNGSYDEGEIVLQSSSYYEIQTQELDLYGEPTYFNCTDNDITELDLIDTPELAYLTISSNQIESVDLSKTPQLYELNCYNNKFQSLDLSHTPGMKLLTCSDNELTSIDLSHTPLLELLVCGGNQLTKLDLSNQKKLTRLYCHRNKINEMNMQTLVESMPTVDGLPGQFYVIDTTPGVNEENVCNEDQVGLAVFKNWKVKNVHNNVDYPGTTSLEDISTATSPIKLYAQDGKITITGIEAGMKVDIYSLSGNRVHSSKATANTVSIALAAGSYVLHIGKHSAKVIVH